MKIRHALEMIGEYGALKSVGRVLGGVFYRLAIPVYSLFICLTTAVDPKKVLFESTPAFSDNSWEMFMYLRDTSEEQYRFVWLYAPEDRLRTLENTKVVSKYSFYSAKHTTIRAIREIATSKYIFFTHSSPVEEFRPRKGQIVVNLWHGCGYKDVQKNNKAPLKFDIALVPGKAFVHTKAHFWNCSEDKILPIGYPRYDELLKSNEMAEQWAKALKANRKLVLWMPTFRSTNRHMYPEERIHQKYDLPLLSSHDQMLELDEF